MKTKEKNKESKRKLSATYRPQELTLEQWQKGLRRQAAASTPFGIKPSKYNKGTYSVISPSSGNEYKVVYRGEGSEWNYCSCMDFRTNQLATCKHLEAVARWVRSGRNRLAKGLPSYSSVYLSYRGERRLRLRIGTDHAEELPENTLDTLLHASLYPYQKEGIVFGFNAGRTILRILQYS